MIVTSACLSVGKPADAQPRLPASSSREIFIESSALCKHFLKACRVMLQDREKSKNIEARQASIFHLCNS